MANPETDSEFRQRIAKVCNEADRSIINVSYGQKLDEIGRKYDKFRFGQALFPDKQDSASS